MYYTTHHECQKECSGLHYHQSRTDDLGDTITWYMQKVRFIEFEYGHIVFYLRHKSFCWTCSLFNPKILYYEIRERIRDYKIGEM